MAKDRYFRATIYDAAYPEQNLVIEFEAPFPIKEEENYSDLALRALLHHIRLGIVKFRDIEPIEESY